MFAEVTSANVVGYMNVTRPQVNFCSGSMFSNIGSEGISLADLKITGTMTAAQKAQWRNCNITFFQAGNTAKFDANRKFWMDWNGKWRKFTKGVTDPDQDPFMTEDEIAAEVINPGEGFVCAFANASAKIIYSGEVITGGNNKTITIARPQVNFIVTNPAGRTITLADIKISGTMTAAQKAQWRNCNITFFQTGNTAKFDADRKFWMDWNGKWRKFTKGVTNPDQDPFMTEDEIAAVQIPAGEGFACAFANASATITLPTAL